MNNYENTNMYKEIYQSIEILKTLYDVNKDTLLKIKEDFDQRTIKYGVVSGRGTSENALLFFRYLTEIMLGISVDISSPSTSTLYNSKLDYSNALVLAVSQSGEARDALEMIKDANEQDALTISITNFKDSPLAKEAKYHLFLNCEREISLAATKTFSAQLYLLSALVYTLNNDDKNLNELKDISSLLSRNIDTIESISTKLADALKDENDGFVLARGIGLAIAEESRVKLSETCYERIQSYSSATFMHGPLALVDEGTFILLIAPKLGPIGTNDSQRQAEHQSIIAKFESLKANLHIITNDESIHTTSGATYYINENVEEQFYLFIVTLIIQLTAVKTSYLKGINPDSPRSLNKVTITK